MNDFSILDLVSILRKSIWYIISVMLVFAVAAYVFCTVVAVPTYQAKASFIATNGGVGTDLEDGTTIKSTDVAASLALINTYIGILKSNAVYKEVAEEVDLGYSAFDIKSMTTVECRDEDALFIDVRVTSENPEHSVKIVNAFLEKGSKFVLTKMPKAYIEAVEVSNSASKNYPNTLTTVFLAAFVGFVLVVVIAIIIDMFDKTIKGEENFAENYDIPILGNVPNFKVAAKGDKKI